MQSNTLIIIFIFSFVNTFDYIVAQNTNSSQTISQLFYPAIKPRISFAASRAEPNNKPLLYPYSEHDFLSDVNSLKQLHDQPLPFRLPYFGFAFNYIWIHKDGYVAFNKGLRSYSFPVSFPTVPSDTSKEEDPSMIAVWFAHQDIPSDVDGAGVYFRIIDLGAEHDLDLRDMILNDFADSMAGSYGFVPTFALIITWKNMTFANKRPEKLLKTNTYQMVIATNEINTFVMFNYEYITWITHLDNYDGLNGPQAFIGFNAGNSTRAFEYVPYSQNPRVSLLPILGYGNGLLGRYFFQIDEVIFTGACIEKELDPNLPDRLGLTTSINYFNSMGGEVVNITGPCFSPDSNIYCRFNIWKVKGKFITENIAACISPTLFWEGYIDITVTVDDKTFFYSRIYIQSPESRKQFDVNVVEYEILEKNPNSLKDEEYETITIEWDSEKITSFIWDHDKRVSISLWGYQENTDAVYPSLSYIADLATGIANTGEFLFNYNSLSNLMISRYDYHFGFIAVNLTNTAFTPTQWSKPMPLGWFLRKHWIREYGSEWNRRFCSDWFERESQEDRFAATVFRCPCTSLQSELDRGRFAPDIQCNIIDKKCDSLHHGSQQCKRSARPSVGGSGQKCCYDDYGELVQSADTMFGGRPSRAFVYGKHPFRMRRMIPTMSYWQYDIMPFFHCCKWESKQDNSDFCQMYDYWRTSQDCSSYQPPAIASIYGDPHIITFDRLNYTFNGKGEYVLVHVDNAVHKLTIHGRFEQIKPNLNATHLTAIAIRDNVSSIIEFRIRPQNARWNYQMFLISDKEYYFYWDANMKSVNLKGATVYEPAGIRNMSHLIAQFDSGAGVEVMVSAVGSLVLNVYIPNTFINSTSGLLGNYSRHQFDEFVLPDGSILSNPESLTTRQIHELFAQRWRLLETNQKYVSPSLFFHDVVSHSNYDNHRFEPKYEITHEDMEQHPEVERICSDTQSCIYDYLVTQDSSYAEQTKQYESYAETKYTELSTKVVRCPALPKPKNGRKSENRYWIGTIVRFACNDGYRLIGYEVRRCREDGLWSWGVDPQCIRQFTYSLILSSIFVAVVIPVLVIVLLIVVCYRRQRNEKNKLQISPRLPPKFQQNSKPPPLPPKTYEKSGEIVDQIEVTNEVITKSAVIEKMSSSSESESSEFGESDDEERVDRNNSQSLYRIDDRFKAITKSDAIISDYKNKSLSDTLV